MQKGPVREGKGTAVIRFFFWLAVLLILLLVVYFLIIEGNYDDNLQSPESTWRAYVVSDNTPVPTPTVTPSVSPTLESGVPTASPPPYATPTATPEETVEPTPTPTPAPTAIPVSALVNGTYFTIDSLAKSAPTAEEVVGGISKCYVSPQNQYTVMQVNGWAYLEAEQFDGERSAAFLYVVNGEGEGILYNTFQEAGISGVEHSGVGSNLEYADFTCCIETASYADGVYYLAVVVEAEADGKRYYFSRMLEEETYTFTVRDGEVIDPIPLTTEEEVSAVEPAVSAEGMEPAPNASMTAA